LKVKALANLFGLANEWTSFVSWNREIARTAKSDLDQSPTFSLSPLSSWFKQLQQGNRVGVANGDRLIGSKQKQATRFYLKRERLCSAAECANYERAQTRVSGNYLAITTTWWPPIAQTQWPKRVAGLPLIWPIRCRLF